MDEARLSGVELTRILKAWSGGDASALERLTPLVYAELHRIASRSMADEKPGHVLQPSALVNEVFLRLNGNARVDWESRGHFFAFSARLMRQILIDFARAQNAAKRGGQSPHGDLSIAHGLAAEQADPVDLLDLDAALDELAALDRRRAQVVELRYFGGLENREIAATLAVSEATVERDWAVARAWLFDRLQPPGRPA